MSTPDRIREYAKAVAAEAPPLSERQRETIRRICAAALTPCPNPASVRFGNRSERLKDAA